MPEASFYQDGDTISFTSVNAVAAGEVLQVTGGRAGVAVDSCVAGGIVSCRIKNIHKLAKTADEVHLPGQRIYWDASASTATCVPSITAGDFFIGCCADDIAGSSATTSVDLNNDTLGTIDQRVDTFASLPVLTAGDPRAYNVGGGLRFTIDATSEAQKIDALSHKAVALAGDWIFFAHVNMEVASGSATDFTVGMASGTDATDAQSIAELATIHIDGASANILVQSDDGTTDLAPVDSTYDWAAGVPFSVAIDGRDITNIKMYINGLLEAGAGTPALTAGAGPLKALVHVEKTTGTNVATMTVSNLKVTTADL